MRVRVLVESNGMFEEESGSEEIGRSLKNWLRMSGEALTITGTPQSSTEEQGASVI